MNDFNPLAKIGVDQLEIENELRQPLSRKVPISSSKINPYRVIVLFRLVVLALFFRYRVLNPVKDAYGLWITSVLCEAWFSLAWILGQLPKWQPVYRETFPQRLCLRYNQPGQQSMLAGIDVFVSVVDPLKEPALITANTVLSVLAVDYPAERVSCYVSDDGADLLILEVLFGTCEFAKKWVPFCRKFNIEPRSPECYFSRKVDYLKYNIFPTFAKERRTMKRQYEEFKVLINSIVAKFQNIPSDGWTIKDGTPWPGNNTQNHPGMIQILLGRHGQHDCDDEKLPQLVYVSREKRPGFPHNKKSGAMNALARVSAILSNGAYIINLDHNHYINNSRVFLEAMCFLMDPSIGGKTCFVQFPQRYNDDDPNDCYVNHNAVFYDIYMKGLDGIQGPLYMGMGCFFSRKALYGYYPRSELNNSRLNTSMSEKKILSDTSAQVCHEDSSCTLVEKADKLERVVPSSLQSLEKPFGESQPLLASIFEHSGFPQSTTPEELLKEAVHVISCDYEDKTAWGKEIGWIYGFPVGDILTGFMMHARGWRSIYCMPSRPAFKGSAPINFSDRLDQVLRRALSSVQITFSRFCPLWFGYGGQLKWLERISYVNSTIYPFKSIPMVVYCTLPAICLLTGKFILPWNNNIGSIWPFLLLVSVLISGSLEMRWSVGIQEWWTNQQFIVITGVSSNFFAVVHSVVKFILGSKSDLLLLTETSAENEITNLYAFWWTSLLIVPTTLIIVNLWAIVAGLSSSISSGFVFWGSLFNRLFFSLLVITYLFPFLKGVLIRQNRVPTVVIIWSLLLAMLFSLLWVRVDPFITRFKSPSFSECGINC